MKRQVSKGKQIKVAETALSENRVIGYSRVSTNTQDTERQANEIRKYAQEKKLMITEMIIETASTRQAEREIHTLLETMKKGDVIIVSELSRLARGTIDAQKIIIKCKETGIDLHAIAQNIIVKAEGTHIEKMVTDLVIALSISFADMERNTISERTKSALRVKKEMGMQLGRPKGKGKKLEDYFKIHPEEKTKYLMLKDAGLSMRKIAKDLKVNPVTVSEYFKANKIQKE